MRSVFMYRAVCVLLSGIILCFFNPVSASVFAQSSDFCVQVTEIPFAECSALVTMYHSLNGAQWRNNSGWLVSERPCEWHGVECRGGQVIEISLRDNRLSGTIPPEINQLQGLQYLELGDNHITGTLPEEIGQLTQLRGLNLRSNRLQGHLPDEVGKLELLEWLYVSGNDFEGMLPVSLSSLSHLHTLYFRDTQLCEPLQPAFQEWLDQITSLGRSEISCNCSVMSGIPAIECRALFALYYRTHGEQWIQNSNWLQTPAPCDWQHIQCEDGHVTGLSLGSNNLQGYLPPELGHLDALTTLDLHQNQLTGQIPQAIGRLTSLTHLNLRENLLEGPLPSEIGQLQTLEFLDISQNRLDGLLPRSLGSLQALRSLRLAQNQFSGPLPSSLGQLRNLMVLDVSQNPLYGPPPGTLANLRTLGVLDVSQTLLRGALPSALFTIPDLQVLRFEGTNICVSDHPGVQTWMQNYQILTSTTLACPPVYAGFLPLTFLLIVGSVLLLPGFYLACVAVFGESFIPPERLAGYYRKYGAPREGLPIQLLVTGLFAFSVELLWGVCSLFATDTLGYGFGIGLMLYLGYIIAGRHVSRRTRITWIGRIIGLLICVFLACFLLLTIDWPYSSFDIVSLVAYILLIVLPVWFMTAGVSTGGYWELMAEGLLLGGIWGVLSGGILGEALCAHLPFIYGGMSDLLTYRVFSQTLPDTTRRFFANELTGIFLFSVVGTGAGALARSLQAPVISLKLPIHLWIRDRLRPVLQALRKTA